MVRDELHGVVRPSLEDGVGWEGYKALPDIEVLLRDAIWTRVHDIVRYEAEVVGHEWISPGSTSWGLTVHVVIA